MEPAWKTTLATMVMMFNNQRCGSIPWKVARNTAGQTTQKLHSSRGSAHNMQTLQSVRDATAKQVIREGLLSLVWPLAVWIVVIMVRNTAFAERIKIYDKKIAPIVKYVITLAEVTLILALFSNEITVGPACKSHWCKVKMDVRSIWRSTKWA